MPKHEELEGIKGIILDCYNTLIDIKTDDDSVDTYRQVSNWLIYQGVKIDPEELMAEYKKKSKEEQETWREKTQRSKSSWCLARSANSMLCGISTNPCWSGGDTSIQGCISKNWA